MLATGSSSLVERLRRRAPEASHELLAGYFDDLRATAYLILRDLGEAEDVAMETLETAWERIHELRDDRQLRPWLIKIATNRSLSLRRRAALAAKRLVYHQNAGTKDLAEIITERIVVQRAVAALPIRMRAAVVLRYYSDLGIDDVAIALGVAPNTVKTELRLALKHLRRSLAPRNTDG